MAGSAPDIPGNGANLFGPDPVSHPLAWYRPPDAAADIFGSAPPDVAARWTTFADGLAAQAQGDLRKVQGYLDRHVEDLGLAFRLTGDQRERPWPLNPMPIILGAAEWEGIERGLIQRARLLEAVIADIYGKQSLIADGHLPAAVVSGSAHFARRMVGSRPPDRHHLQICVVDLARGPGGEWRVLSDRVRLAVGIGYALENRIALNRATGGLLATIGARRQDRFFESLRRGIAASCERAEPRIGLLTPGRFNQSYPEQAHLARHLGFSLVEGRDLTVRDDRLFVRTIAGLKRIDALWRWISTRDIDPLNFDTRSEIGVPNLVSAAENGLVLANWPGAGVIESRAMPAFLPKLARTMLGETLLLPNAATWWCGGETERAEVLRRFDELVFSSAFNRPVAGLEDGRTRPGSSFSDAEREALLRGLETRPMDYTAQEIVNLSTTPALIDGAFEPRGFTLRAYLVRDEHGHWTALPGGFARISEHGDLRTSLMGMGDIATDVCVVDPQPDRDTQVVGEGAPAIRREQGLLPSQAADNLFWMGRYSERAHQTVRIVRTLIEQVALSGTRKAPVTTVTRLANLLRGLGAVPPESIKWQPSRLIGAALGDQQQAGSVRALSQTARQVALLLRDRLTRDAWRAVQHAVPNYAPGDMESMSSACDLMVERFAALTRLMADGISHGPAYRFLDLGICLERASIILQAAQTMVPGSASAEDLSALLDLVDAQASYRSRYMAMPYIAPVFDMVLLDPAQPRGLAFQIQRIEQHLAALPRLEDDGMPERQVIEARRLASQVECLDAGTIDSATLSVLRSGLFTLSDAIAERYFLPTLPANKRDASLLA